MKKISLFILASLFTVLFISCGNEKAEEEAAEEMAENLVEGLFEKATGGGIDIDINEDGEEVEMTIGGEDGASITIKDGGKEIPENFPEDVYIVKGEIESAGSVNSGEGNLITVVIYPEDSFKDVVTNIKKEMKTNGWTSAMNMNMGGEAMQMYTKDKNSATITINGKDDKVEVAYLVTVSNK